MENIQKRKIKFQNDSVFRSVTDENQTNLNANLVTWENKNKRCWTNFETRTWNRVTIETISKTKYLRDSRLFLLLPIWTYIFAVFGFIKTKESKYVQDLFFLEILPANNRVLRWPLGSECKSKM